MSRDTITQLIAALVLCACMALSGVFAINLTGMAGSARLSYTDRAEEGQPPEVTLGIAMGAFRGIFVNYLWMRANDMKEAGKFYEAMQLATAITKLQPRFPRVWVFHAWNMAYNISVTTQTPQERWAWVNAGVNLLRDKGIVANPNDMLLHKELGWIFLHKIGGFTDDANVYYKKQLAAEWTVVLGPPPVRTAEDRDRAFAIKKLTNWLKVLEDAPLTLEECVRREPSVQTLMDRIHNEVQVHPEESPEQIYFMLLQYERYRAVSNSIARPLFESQMGPRSKKFGDLAIAPEFERAWTVLIPHLRRRLLVERYHMEPERMARYTETFGPIDWRHHAAHSLYWGFKGVEMGIGRWEERNKLDYDFINTDRIVAQSIQDLFRTGELYFDFLSSFTESATDARVGYQGVPNAHFVESYGNVLNAMAKRSWADGGTRAGSYSPLASGYENFIRDAIVFFFRRGQRSEAEAWVHKLRTDPRLNINDEERRSLLDEPLEVLVNKELTDQLTRPSMMVNQVAGSLMGAYASGLLGGDPDIFLAQFDFAKRVHRLYMEQQLRNTPAGGADQRMKQVDSDFRNVAGTLFFQFMLGLNVDDQELVYNAAPNDLKLYAYTYLVEVLKPEMDTAGAATKPFAQVFPEPQDYKEFIAEARAKAAQERSAPRAPLEQK